MFKNGDGRGFFCTVVLLGAFSEAGSVAFLNAILSSSGAAQEGSSARLLRTDALVFHPCILHGVSYTLVTPVLYQVFLPNVVIFGTIVLATDTLETGFQCGGVLTVLTVAFVRP